MIKTTVKTTNETNQAAVVKAAVGRRKRAVARVRMYLGEGESLINGKPANDFCHTVNQKKQIANPLIVSGLTEKYYYSAKVVGGGINGQVGAVAHGISRCIAELSDSLRTTMSQNGLLRRDPREKERKKIYRVRARKMPQFAKR
ncbi:MAG: 30S ribosomal protein S9 [bacterium]